MTKDKKASTATRRKFPGGASVASVAADPPSLKWSDLKYVFWHHRGLRVVPGQVLLEI